MASIKKISGKRGISYQFCVSIGYDPTGKKLRKYSTFSPPPGLSPAKERKMVEDAARKFESDVLSGKPTDKLTVLEASELWKAETWGTLEPTTATNYEDQLRLRIIPALGHYQLTSLTPLLLGKWLRSLAVPGNRVDGKAGAYSQGTIAKTRNVLNCLLRWAQENMLIEANPLSAVRAIKAEKMADKIVYFSPEQTKAFLEYIEHPFVVEIHSHDRTDDTGISYHVDDYASHKSISEQMRVLFALAIDTGLRKGEILALKWDDIDFSACTVRVDESAAVVAGSQIAKAPKTASSRRTVPVSKSVIRKLYDFRKTQALHQIQMGDRWKGEGWVFTQENGRMMCTSTPYQALQRIIDRYNEGRVEEEKLPHIPFHGLRHTNATLLIDQHLDIAVVSRLLGHAKTSTTSDIYVHALEDQSRKGAEALESLLFSKEA